MYPYDDNPAMDHSLDQISGQEFKVMNNGRLLETMERSQVYREAHEGAILINKGDKINNKILRILFYALVLPIIFIILIFIVMLLSISILPLLIIAPPLLPDNSQSPCLIVPLLVSIA